MYSDFCRGDDDEKEYFVKWKELQYDECSWESESDISAFQPEIERFRKIQSRRRRHSNKLKNICDSTESHKKQKEFQQYEQSPEFLSGGILYCCALCVVFCIFFHLLLLYYFKFLLLAALFLSLNVTFDSA